MLTPLLTLLLACPSQDPIDRAALAEVLEPYLTESGVPGAVVALVVDGRPGIVEAFGLAHVGQGRAMTPDTRFQVGSLTKPITATCVALLAERGRLAWKDPLAEHLPIPEALAGISLASLASHTSGLPREPSNRVDRPGSPSVMMPMSVEQLLAGLDHTQRKATAVESWAYSNLGYALLGEAASRAAEVPFPELVEALVLEPLGMQRSGVFVGDPPQDLAACYWPEDSELIEREPWRFGTACAFSGLVSTGGDLAKFLAAQLGDGEDAFLPAGARDSLHTVRVTIDPDLGRGMTCGWMIDPLPGGMRAVGHGGEVDGHSAVMAFFPELRCGLVVLCNLGDDSAEQLARRVMSVALPRWMQR